MKDRKMEPKKSIDRIKKKQAEEIKSCIVKIVNKYPDYYKDKEYAKKFLNKDYNN